MVYFLKVWESFMIERGRVQREEQKVVGNHFSDRLGAQPYHSVELLCLIISSKSGRSSCNKLATLWWHSITEKNSSPKCLHKFFNHILPPPPRHTHTHIILYLPPSPHHSPSQFKWEPVSCTVGKKWGSFQFFCKESSEFLFESVFPLSESRNLWPCSYGEICCKTGQNGSIYFRL